MKKKQSLIYLALSLLLTGCGGDDSPSSNQPDASVLAPMVENNFAQVLLSDEQKIVSLADNVTDPQGLPVTLTHVQSLTEACEDPTFNAQALTFEVKKDQQDTCYYQYTVQNHPENTEQAKSASADSYVMLTETLLPATLPPLSETTSVGENLTIDLETELAGNYPEGYVLDADVVVLGSGVATADTTNNTINYEATKQGVTRLLYSLVSPDALDIKAGYIDVAVSGDGNNMPVAQSFAGPEAITQDAEVEVDVAGYISDPDDDPLQLTDVYAFNASVSVSDPNDVTNTKFRFSADTPGTYDVSYYVTDHRGGFAVGVVHMTVEGDGGSPMPWDDIVLSDGEVYTAPWEKMGADLFNIPYQITETEVINNVEYQIALFSHAQAVSICHTRGMLLPTQAQLTKLYSSQGNVQNSDGWPVARPYWTDNNTVSVNLASGAVNSSHNTEEPLALTCVYPGELSATVIKDGAYIGLNDFNTIEAMVTTLDGQPKAGERVYLYSTEEALLLSENSTLTDGNGKAMFDVQSETIGAFDATVTYFSQKIDLTVNFIEDLIASLVVTGPDTVGIGETVQLTATASLESGESENVTNSSDWDSSNKQAATVNQTGLVTGVTLGSSTITASKDEKSGTHPIRVIDSWGENGRIEISPQSSNLEIGEEQQFTATVFSAAYPSGVDVTDDEATSWVVSSGQSNGSIDGSGLFIAEASGEAEILATYQMEGALAETDTANVTIEALPLVLNSITVSPTSITVQEGETAGFTATGHYSDGSSEIITSEVLWSSGSSYIASSQGSGVFRGENEGSTGVYASYQGKQGDSSIIVERVFDGINGQICSYYSSQKDVLCSSIASSLPVYPMGGSFSFRAPDGRWVYVYGASMNESYAGHYAGNMGNPILSYPTLLSTNLSVVTEDGPDYTKYYLKCTASGSAGWIQSGTEHSVNCQ